MIKYNASDIVKRAKQLADLENSDFITWNEDINLLNEQYVSMFQKLINTGDKSFVRSFKTIDKEFLLPSDFWQLKGCYMWNNGNLKPILRRAENQTVHSAYYDIQSGVMKINGCDSREILVEYYKQPSALTFPSKDKLLDLPGTYETYELTWKAVKGKFAVAGYSDGENSHLVSYNMDKGTFKDSIQLGEYSYIFFTKKYAVIQNTSEDIVIWDFRLGNSYSSNSFDFVCVYSETDDLYVYSEDTQKITSVVIGDNTFTLGMTVCENPIFSGDSAFCDKYFSDFYGFDFVSGNCYHNSDQLENIFFDSNSFYKDNGLYSFSDYGLVFINDTESEIISDVFADSENSFVGFDDNTGYGYFVNDLINEEVKIVSFCNDTELDFPNSFYFNILAYYMAIAYKSKQGGDTSLLSAQLTQQEETFLDTLGDDDFQSVRMTNVY